MVAYCQESSTMVLSQWKNQVTPAFQSPPLLLSLLFKVNPKFIHNALSLRACPVIHFSYNPRVVCSVFALLQPRLVSSCCVGQAHTLQCLFTCFASAGPRPSTSAWLTACLPRVNARMLSSLDLNFPVSKFQQFDSGVAFVFYQLYFSL